MSLRQIRRLRELKQAAANEQKDSGSEPASSDLEETNRNKNTRNIFSKNLLSSDSSSSSSSSPSEAEEEGRTIPIAESPKIVAAPKIQAKKTAPKVKPKEKAVARPGIKFELDPSLKIDIKILNPASELKRIFGASVPSVPFRGIKRRHWLIQPEAGWPLVVKECFRMEICKADSAFRLVPEPEYESKLKTLSRIVITHDVEALYQFVHFNPFHVHGLIQLASTFIEKSEYENAYQLVRRSLYALQSSFLPAFHPNSKSLLLSQDSIFSSVLLRALLLYSHLLAGQGCSRTSFEILKVVYAMEGGMLAGCPRTHALIHIEAAAYKADQFSRISHFINYNRLHDIFPGSAFLFAIALKKVGQDSDDPVTISDVRRSCSEKTTATCALMKALLMFPFAVKIIFGLDNPNGVARTSDPFTNRLALAFASKCSARIKIDDQIMQWVKAVIDNRLPGILAQGLLELEPRKPSWLLSGYSSLSSAEFEWGKSSSGSFVEPKDILDSEAQVLEIYSEEAGEEELRNQTRESTGTQMRVPVSLESNPVAAFFQTLLPWATVDTAGTEATPFTANTFLRQLQSSIGIGQPVIAPADQSYSDSENSHSHSGSSDDEEIFMDR